MARPKSNNDNEAVLESDNPIVESDKTTVWKNTKNVEVRFSLCVGETRRCPVFKEIIIPPNSAIRLRSVFDQAIRTEVDGRIMGGKCPWLLKNDETELTNLHPCLDFEKVEEELKINALAEEIKNHKAQAEARELLENRAKQSK